MGKGGLNMGGSKTRGVNAVHDTSISFICIARYVYLSELCYDIGVGR